LIGRDKTLLKNYLDEAILRLMRGEKLTPLRNRTSFGRSDRSSFNKDRSRAI
jgi:hypothetical protein